MRQPHSISPAVLSHSLTDFCILDVRKAPARSSSGMTIAGSVYQKPFDAENWWPSFKGRQLVVFCVHGHEVSRAVAGFLRDQGLPTRILRGGFEAWRAGGFPVIRIPDDNA